MNNLETAKPFMEQLKELLRNKSIELNSSLSKAGLRNVDFEQQLTRIEEQIKSAETKYTIAIVGTFKTGKSTIINSLLNLKGSARLSSEYDPDTAKCIRLMSKEKGQKHNAEVLFLDTYETEYLDWEEAKKYTSQVALNAANSEINKKAEKIDEIRYYIDNPFLDVCNILDLPGTGAGEYEHHHTTITDIKGQEADFIFWVVSTDAEPDKETIKNLEKFNTKMLPIINVWQIESENISSELTAEDIKEILLNQFGAYFASAENPVEYYAGEIDSAQQEDRELKEEWGKAAFTDKVEEILANIQVGDRMQRIKKYISVALQECDLKLKDILENNAFKSLVQSEKNEGLEINKIRSRLSKAQQIGISETKDQAKKTAQGIINIFTDASDAFIENKMQGINFGALFRKDKFQKELKNDFEKNYVRINSGWLDKAVKEFSDDVMAILNGCYVDFAIDISTINNDDSFSMEEDDLSGFIDSMVKIMGQNMVTRIAPTIISLIAGGIMLLIPGGAIIEAIATTLTSGITAAKGIMNDDKLRSKINGIKNASKVQIRQQRYTVVTNLSDSAKQINEKMYNSICAKLDERSSANEEKKTQLRILENTVKNMIAFVNEQSEELAKI